MAISSFRNGVERVIPWACGLVFATVCLVCAGWIFAKDEIPTIRMSAGPEQTRRHSVAKYLCEQAANHNLKIQLLASAGSEACLNQIKSGQLDAALVSNGVVVPNDDAIRVLAAIQLEAVHVLVRKELVGAGPLSEAIRGKRVNLGVTGSCEWLLARDFLSFARLKLPTASEPGDIVPMESSKEQLIDQAHAILAATGDQRAKLVGELPDCLLVLASMPSMIVPLLAEAADYQIKPLPAARAFLMDNLQDSNPTTTTIEREFLEPTAIPAHSYFTTRPFPAADCGTVGMRLLIVAHKDLSAEAIRPLMETVFEGEFSRRILPKSPRELATPFPIHPAGVAYLDRDKPLAWQQAAEWVSQFLSIFGAFSAGALSLYGILWRKKVRMPADYYAEIRKIEMIAGGTDTDATAPIEPKEFVKYLDDRLLRLRQDLIEDICEGRIKGEQVIANILALLKDARRNLPHRDDDTFDPTGLGLRPAVSLTSPTLLTDGPIVSIDAAHDAVPRPESAQVPAVRERSTLKFRGRS